MEFKKSRIISVLCATLLFAMFSVVHQNNWLIPSSQITSEASCTSMPISEMAEELGNEDEMEHINSDPDFLPVSRKFVKTYIVCDNYISPQVPTPPPDKA